MLRTLVLKKAKYVVWVVAIGIVAGMLAGAAIRDSASGLFVASLGLVLIVGLPLPGIAKARALAAAEREERQVRLRTPATR